jgi:type II secretory pathway pseudopilin PulG
MRSSPSIRAFTVTEMVVAMVIIVTLMALFVVLAKPISITNKRARAQGELLAIISACEAHRVDQGGYPQDNSPSGTSVTDTLDPRIHLNATTPVYAAANLFLYQQLTGDKNANGAIDAGETARKYAADFFRSSRLDSSLTSGMILYIKDPFGNPYGYSTAGLKAEQSYRVLLETNPTAVRTVPSPGYNPTFDLWSTGDSTIPLKWIKNW